MREILFRGKSVHSGEWRYGSLVRVNEQALIVPIPDFPEQEYEDQNVVPETVVQYTGLKDKHGNRIFEGDRILYSNSLERGEGIISFERGSNIEWDLSTVVTTKPISISPLFYFGCSAEIEIISNIHDQKGGVES